MQPQPNRIGRPLRPGLYGLTNPVIYLFIYTFFGNSPTGQTRQRIFTLDGSNDADSRVSTPILFYIACSFRRLRLLV